MTNQQIAELFRKMAAAYEILGENRFKTIAYDRAADSIEHLTSDVKDLWDDGKLGEIPGVGGGIAHYLDELFKAGKVKHFQDVMKRVPEAVFPLLSVPGIGPKKAYKLVQKLKLRKAQSVVSDLETAAKDGRIAPMEGFGQKSQEDILSAIETFRRGQIKENRMDLPTADAIAHDVIEYLRKVREVTKIDVLGSLRRKVATIGDIDIAVATNSSGPVIEHFVTYPHQKLIEKGPTGASLLLHSGRQVDVRVQKPEAYGAMLQYFTGSKNHNIRLRSFALQKGFSLNEYGIKNMKTGKAEEYVSEDRFYKAIGLPWIAPELREDKGEIEAALHGKLPFLLKPEDIKGDLHIHSDFQFISAHDLGTSPLSKHLDIASSLGYEYIGISDHNPASNLPEKEICTIMDDRKAYYEQQLSSWTKRTRKSIHVFIMCEIDILSDGRLALPSQGFDYLDAAIVSLHSSFQQEKTNVTKRIIKGLTAHPKVRIFGHPTGRLINKREGVDANWPEVFQVCKERDIALEINSYPDRLDLPDTLVYDARKAGVKFCIDTDSHQAEQMYLFQYGVSVARRGWCETSDIVNTRGYNEFRKWLLR